MTREKFDLKIDEHCNKNSLFLPRHQSISDPDIRDFLWKLAEDHKNIYDDDVVIPFPIDRRAVTVDITSIKKKKLNLVVPDEL